MWAIAMVAAYVAGVAALLAGKQHRLNAIAWRVHRGG